MEWTAISISRGSSQPRNRTRVSRIAGRHVTIWATREAHKRGNVSILRNEQRIWRDNTQKIKYKWLSSKNTKKYYPLQKKKKWSEVKSLSHVRLFATPWTVAYQAPPAMGFSRQEYWSGLLFPSPGDLPNPGIKPGSPALQASQGRRQNFLTGSEMGVMERDNRWPFCRTCYMHQHLQHLCNSL